MFSVDKALFNLNQTTEDKKNYIRKKVNYIIEEKDSIVKEFKKIQLLVVYNITKMSTEELVFEYFIENKALVFDKPNLYLQDYKDLFESANTNNTKVEKEEVSFIL